NINGSTAGSGYSQLNVTGGAVTLAGALALNVTSTFAVGTSFTLIQNHGSTAVSGAFSGLAEGAYLTLNRQLYHLSYQGGTNHNYVPLTRVQPGLSINNVSANAPALGATTSFTFTVTLGTTSSQPVTVHYATADGKASAAEDYVATSGTLTFAPNQTS